MLVGCGMWAYVLGAVTAKVAALDADTARFREDMDALRSFCRVKRLPTEMRLRLKEYFRHRRALLKDVANNRLIEELSPGLRGEVSRYCYSDWLSQVPWVRDGSDGFRTTLSLSLTAAMFAPTELISGSRTDTHLSPHHTRRRSSGARATVTRHVVQEDGGLPPRPS